MATPPEDRELEIFNSALEFATPAERAAYLDLSCGGDTALRAQVDELLRAHEQAGVFLADESASAGVDDSAAEVPLGEGPGTRIGRYKLLEKIGEGGFGVVYMAEQEEPVRRRVALKIIKLGMDTRAVVARFEAERQALAMMDHPGIAKVHDGGATESGRPYFVMEIVRGVTITKFCDERQLTMRQRIDLFMQVCLAVQHAHQKGVIHRDLKPSNILVTMHDDRPVPKVIDFGIAKATEQRLTDKTLFTRFHQFIGTPAYMSPEQTGISGLDIDTRSDIYSLGVLLYELLTGRMPFDQQALLKAGLEEIHRTIRDKDPPSPSHRVSSLTRDEQTTTAQRRRIDPAKLSSELRGDLDRIVMKCMEKDRTRRYETAVNLAQDLTRHLRNEPVFARPDTLGYRARKFIRRNRLIFATATAITAALVVGSAVSIWQAMRATTAARNERTARHAAEQAGDREAGQRALAEQNEESTRRLLYAADLRLAYHAWDEGNLGRVAALLDAQRLQPGKTDLREFAYFHLRQFAAGEQDYVLEGENGVVLSVAISPDGKWLASRTISEVRLWDLTSRRFVAAWKCSGDPEWQSKLIRFGFAVGFSRDSEYMVVESDAGLLLVRPTTRESRLLSTGPGWCSAFSPTANLIAFDPKAPSSGVTSQVHVWDYVADKEVAVFEASGTVLGWSPDGTRLLTGRWGKGTLETWNPATWTREMSANIGQSVSIAAFSPDGRILAAAGWQGEIHLLDPASGQETGSFATDYVRPTALAFSSSGKFIATGTRNTEIQIWNVEMRQAVRRLRGHLGRVMSLVSASDGQTLVSAGDATIRIWNAQAPSGQSRIPNQLRGPASGTAPFSPDGKWLGVNMGPDPNPPNTHRSHILDHSTLETVAAPMGEVFSYSPDGTQFATVTWYPAQLNVWKLGASSPRATIHIDVPPDDSCLKPLLSADGTVFAHLRRENQSVILTEAATGKIITTRETSSPICFLPRDAILAYKDGATIRLLDAHTMETRGSFDCESVVRFLAVSRDGARLAAVMGATRVALWDLGSGTRLATLVGHQSNIEALAFSPDGQTLASGGEDRTIKLWHVATFRELASFVKDRAVYWLNFSPDGQSLVWGGIGAYEVIRAPREVIAPSLGIASDASKFITLPANSLWNVTDNQPNR